MRRRLLWLVLGVAAVLGVAVWFDRSLDPITPRTFERIEEGMTLSQVEAIIGRQGYDHKNDDKNGPVTHSGIFGIIDRNWSRYSWSGNSYAIEVFFAEDRAVLHYMSSYVPPNDDRVLIGQYRETRRVMTSRKVNRCSRAGSYAREWESQRPHASMTGPRACPATR